MKNKKILITTIIGTVTLGVVLSYFLLNSSKFNNESNSVPTDSNYVTDTDQELTDGVTPDQDKIITPTPDTDDETTDSTVLEKPMVTRAEQSGDFVRVSATFTNSSTGNCVLTLSQSGSNTVTKTVGIVVGPSYYTCNGFRVPIAELSSGEWVITVAHQLGEKTTLSDEITVRVQ